MPRLRRFKVSSLEGMTEGSVLRLPETEVKHLGVLRLDEGVEIEIFDGLGWRSRARLLSGIQEAILLDTPASTDFEDASCRLLLATAWPKGKRAATLVEKCTELGVSAITPLRCERSVVRKRSDSEGVQRLQRIADEAAKQAGRNHSPKIQDERSFEDLLGGEGNSCEWVLLEPRANQDLSQILADLIQQKKMGEGKALGLLIGPEGGFTQKELAVAEARGVAMARLSPHVLRVETAAIAACAVAGMYV